MKFEDLGIVRDGSKSTYTKSVYDKGYHVTEAVALTTSNHPVSIFSELHSSNEKNFSSKDDVINVVKTYFSRWRIMPIF